MIGAQNQEAIPESQVQITSGYEHLRTISPTNEMLLTEILNELRKMNTQLSLITDEEIQ